MAISVSMDFHTDLVFRDIDKKGIRNIPPIEFDFTLSDEITGDGSGGSITTAHNLGDSNNKVFYLITDFFVRPVNSSAQLNFIANTFEKFTRTGLASINLLNQAAYSFTNDQILGTCFYLGQPKTAGTLQVVWGTNTDSETYRVLICGIALKEPLPCNTITRNINI